MSKKLELLSFSLLNIGFLLIFQTIGCVSQEVQFTKKQLTLKETPEKLEDDLKLVSLISALEKNVQALKENKNKFLSFGDQRISKTLYIKALNYFLDLIKLEKKSLKQESDLLFDFIRKHFDFYAIDLKKTSRIKHKLKANNVFITSYYAPLIQGSKIKTKKYSQPLYKTPKDLVQLKLNEFKKASLDVSNYEREFEEKKRRKRKKRRKQKKHNSDQQKSDNSNFLMSWGRIVRPEKKNSLSLTTILPFYSRKEIDTQNKILNRNLILAWVQPLDAFFLQIQGSGTIEFKNGRRLHLGYHAQNGFPYVPIGKYINLPKEEITLSSIISHLLSLSKKERQNFLNLNPSYVFFKKLQNKKTITSLGTEAVPGRTIATDIRFFPKGALAYLEFKKPVFSKENNTKPKEWQKVSRFVIDQDSGGAIRGPHRMDLFWGEGDRAGWHAGVMKNWGKLYYLTPKLSFLDMLDEGKNQ